MSAPLQNYFNRQLGGDDINGPGSWALRQWMQRARANRCGEAELFGHPVVEVGGDEDVSGEYDDLGAFDGEVSAIEGDDDDEVGARDPQARLEKMREKKRKLESKRTKAQQKAGAARMAALRKLWTKRVEKLDDKIEDLEKDIKAEKKRLQKLGLLAAGAGAGAAARGAGAGAARRAEIEREMDDDPDAPDGVIVPEEPVYPRVESVPDEQQQIELPFLTNTGLDVFSGQWAEAVAANTQRAINGQTGQINYAAFEVRGIKVVGYYQGLLVADTASVSQFNPPIKVTLQNITVEGDINLLYGNNSFELGGALGGAPHRTVISSLRSRPILDRNSNAQVLGFMENPLAIPSVPGTATVDVAVAVSLLCKVRYDTKVRRGR